MSNLKRLSDELRELADRMDNHDSHIIRYIHDHFLRPLQECQLFTKTEIAELLNVSSSQVTKLIKTGKLHTTADGRVSEYNVREYITRNEQTDLPNPTL